MNHATFESDSTQERSPWGCLLGGCLSMFLFLVVAMAGAGFFGYRYLKSEVAKYTSDSPQELPVVEYSDEQVEALTARVESLKSAIKDDGPLEPLVLTEEDVNGLISQHEELRGKVYVRIGDGQVSGDLSIPTDKIPGASGRFFNGSITMNVALDNGVLVVTLDQATVNGEPVPEEILANLREENLAANAYKDPDTAKLLSKVKRLEIRDDTVILIPAGSE